MDQPYPGNSPSDLKSANVRETSSGQLKCLTSALAITLRTLFRRCPPSTTLDSGGVAGTPGLPGAELLQGKPPMLRHPMVLVLGVHPLCNSSAGGCVSLSRTHGYRIDDRDRLESPAATSAKCDAGLPRVIMQLSPQKTESATTRQATARSAGGVAIRYRSLRQSGTEPAEKSRPG